MPLEISFSSSIQRILLIVSKHNLRIEINKILHLSIIIFNNNNNKIIKLSTQNIHVKICKDTKKNSL